jgi:hypothetical protein
MRTATRRAAVAVVERREPAVARPHRQVFEELALSVPTFGFKTFRSSFLCSVCELPRPASRLHLDAARVRGYRRHTDARAERGTTRAQPLWCVLWERKTARGERRCREFWGKK